METIDKLMMAEALQECLSCFLEIDTLKSVQSEALEALISGRDVIAILPTGFGKSLIFQLFCEVKLTSNPNTCILTGCPAKQHRGRSDQCKMRLTGLHNSYGSWHLYIWRFLFGFSAYVASLLFMKGTSCFVIRTN